MPKNDMIPQMKSGRPREYSTSTTEPATRDDMCLPLQQAQYKWSQLRGGRGQGKDGKHLKADLREVSRQIPVALHRLPVALE